jgi:iron(III) transport system permease protein
VSSSVLQLGRRARSSGRALVNSVLGLFVLVPLVCIIVPIGVTVAMSLWSTTFGGDGGHLTLANYVAAFTSRGILNLLSNTLILTAGGAVGGTALGLLMAWISTSTNCPFPRLMYWLPVAPIAVPVLVKDLGWIMLYDNRTGLVNVGLDHIGLHGIFNIYSMQGMIVVLAFSTAPFAYLILVPALASINRDLVEASAVSGAGRRVSVLRIMFPLIRPAVLSAFAVSTLLVATSFETPVLIGLPAGINTYISTIYQSIAVASDPDFNLASAQAVIYLVISMILLAGYLRSTRSANRFEVVGGRGYTRGARMNVGNWRWLLFAVVIIYFFLAFVQLVLANLVVSLMPYYTVTNGNPFRNFTFQFYRQEFTRDTLGTIWSSLWLAVVVALVTTAFALLLSIVAHKSRTRLRGVVEIVSTLPLALPSLVFGVSLFLTVLFVPSLIVFYGSTIPMIVASVVVFLPLAIRIVSNATMQVSDDLLEAARVAGASWTRSSATVLVPLLGLAITNTLVLVFMQSFRELGAIVLLIPPNLHLLPVTIFSHWEQGQTIMATVLNVFSIVVPVCILGLAFGIRAIIRSVLRVLRGRAGAASHVTTQEAALSASH